MGVLVGTTGVLVGTMGVLVGTMGVLVGGGGMGVLVGGGGIGVRVGRGVWVGWGVKAFALMGFELLFPCPRHSFTLINKVK
jgi:hypothetical protein